MAKSAQKEQAKSNVSMGFAFGKTNLASDDRCRPVYRQLYQSIKEAILSGAFPNGARLPSSRSLATQLSLSRTTVDLAYGLLAGDGLVCGRTAKGTLVTSGASAVSPSKPLVTASASEDVHRIKPLIHAQVAIDLFPREIWSRLSTRHAKSFLPEDLLRQEPAGLPRLREAIANRIRLVRGMACDAHQVFVTAGVGSAIWLTLAAVEAFGKAAIADTTTMSWSVYQALRSLGVTLRTPGLQSGAHRWPAAVLAMLNAEDLAIRGMEVDDVLEGALTDWVRTHGAWLIEEDHDLDLFHDGSHPSILQRGTTKEFSIYLGSFERSLFPAVGCGFVVAPSLLADRFQRAAEQSPVQASVQSQRVLSDFITQGYIGRYANQLRRAHAVRRQAALAALANGRATQDLRFWDAGSYLVARLDIDFDVEALSAALRVAQLGAEILRVRDLPCSLLRMGYAAATPKESHAAIEQLNSVFVAHGFG